MRRKTLIVALSLAVGQVVGAVPPSAAQASSRNDTRSEFLKLWQQRLAGYRAQAAQTSAAHKMATQAILNPTFQFAEGDGRLNTFLQATIADGEVGGRGQILTDFISHIQTKPSVGLTQAWLQSQFDALRSETAAADRMKADALATLSSKDSRLMDFLAKIEAAALKRGDAEGRSEELVLLVSNFGAYADEIAAADARDEEARQRFRAALAGMARGMQAQTPWSVQCTRAFNTINCTGQ